MTPTEFKSWSERLFVAFPSLYEWLTRNSPNAGATLTLWRESLEGYSLEECDSVLRDWQTGIEVPFAAYDRDKLPLIVRSVVDKRRDKQRAQREQRERLEAYQGKRRGAMGGAESKIMTDPIYIRAREIMQPHYDARERGEITLDEYKRRFDETWDKLRAEEIEAEGLPAWQA